MPSQVDYYFEEYKFLKEEVKLFSENNMKDFQIILAIAAIFIGFYREGIAVNQWFIIIANLFYHFFIVVQLSKFSYLLIVRKRLKELEAIINLNSSSKLKWESKVVPSKLVGSKSLSSITQIYIIILYIICYIFFQIYAWCKLPEILKLCLFRGSLNWTGVLYYTMSIISIPFLMYFFYKLFKEYRQVE